MLTRRHPRRRPSHPGAMLRDIIPLGCSKARLARALGISRYQLSEILAEKRAVTKATARRLESVVGGSAQSWTDMQSAYDEWP
jgi:addiction module HigA family antidote